MERGWLPSPFIYFSGGIMSPKENIVKCRYSHCKHDTKEIPKDEAYKNGNAYYHKDCY